MKATPRHTSFGRFPRGREFLGDSAILIKNDMRHISILQPAESAARLEISNDATPVSECTRLFSSMRNCKGNFMMVMTFVP